MPKHSKKKAVHRPKSKHPKVSSHPLVNYQKVIDILLSFNNSITPDEVETRLPEISILKSNKKERQAFLKYSLEYFRNGSSHSFNKMEYFKNNFTLGLFIVAHFEKFHDVCNEHLSFLLILFSSYNQYFESISVNAVEFRNIHDVDILLFLKGYEEVYKKITLRYDVMLLNGFQSKEMQADYLGVFDSAHIVDLKAKMWNVMAEFAQYRLLIISLLQSKNSDLPNIDCNNLKQLLKYLRSDPKIKRPKNWNKILLKIESLFNKTTKNHTERPSLPSIEVYVDNLLQPNSFPLPSLLMNTLFPIPVETSSKASSSYVNNSENQNDHPQSDALVVDDLISWDQFKELNNCFDICDSAQYLEWNVLAIELNENNISFRLQLLETRSDGKNDYAKYKLDLGRVLNHPNQEIAIRNFKLLVNRNFLSRFITPDFETQCRFLQAFTTVYSQFFESEIFSEEGSQNFHYQKVIALLILPLVCSDPHTMCCGAYKLIENAVDTFSNLFYDGLSLDEKNELIKISEIEFERYFEFYASAQMNHLNDLENRLSELRLDNMKSPSLDESLSQSLVYQYPIEYNSFSLPVEEHSRQERLDQKESEYQPLRPHSH